LHINIGVILTKPHLT